MRSHRSSLVKHRKKLAFTTLRLTGLDAEIQQLHDSYAKELKDEPMVALVSGPSGVGKSALIRTLKEVVEPDGGFFCVGKQEQMSEQTFQAFSEAMACLATALYESGPDNMNRLNEGLSSAISPQLCSLLMETSPELCALFSSNNLIDADSDCEEDLTYNPQHKQLKVQLAYCELLRLVCTEERPIVLVIEDLQWADVATLNLLVSLAGCDSIKGLMIVGSYRDDEVDESHPLTQAMVRMREEKKDADSLTQISLRNLSLVSLNELLAHLVESDSSRTIELAKVIMKKTNGNAFFALQMMGELHQTELIYFDMPTIKWKWDLTAIDTETNLKENVVDLVCAQLKRLPPSIQEGLKIGSCIGSRFDQAMVEGVLHTIDAPESANAGDGNNFQAEKAKITVEPVNECRAPKHSDSDYASLSSGGDLDRNKGGDSDAVEEGIDSLHDGTGLCDSGTDVSCCSADCAERGNGEDNDTTEDNREGNELKSLPGDGAALCDPGSEGPGGFDMSLAAGGSKIDGIDIVDDMDEDSDHKESCEVTSDMSRRPNFDEAVKVSLISRIPGTTIYRFSHDRIQQAAYRMFESEEERAIAHKSLGQFLQLQLGNEQRPDNILIVAEQLNLGSSQLATAEERLNVAFVNVEAGERAMKKGAFKQAKLFLVKASQFVAMSALWKEHVDVAWRLTSMLADVHCIHGDYDDSSESVEALLARANTEEREMEAGEIKMRLLHSRGDLKQMVEFGLKFVRKAGIRMPKRARKLHLIAEFMSIKRLLKKLSEEEILSQPVSNNEKLTKVCSFLNSIGTASFFRDDLNMLFLSHLTILKLSMIHHGPCVHTSVGLATYGVLLAAMGDFDGAFSIGLTAEKMTTRFDNGYIDTFVHVNVNDFLKPLRSPLQQTIDPFLKYFGIGIESGNLSFACSCGALYVAVYYIAGLPLGPLLSDSGTIKRHFMKGNENTMRFNLIINIQTAHTIAGREADPFQFNCVIKEVEKELEAAIQNKNVMALLTYWGMKSSVFYILDPEDERTHDTFHELWKLPMRLIKIHYFYVIICFYSGMAAMTLYRRTRKRLHKRKYRRSIKAIETWHSKGVPWVSHFILILQAERAWLEGRPVSDVKAAFDHAIRMSARTGFPNNCALANERCARFFGEQGDTGWFRYYMEKAIRLYREWGATAKVELLMLNQSLGLTNELSAVTEQGSRSSLMSSNSSLRGRERFKNRYGSFSMNYSVSMSDILRRPSQPLGVNSSALENDESG